MDAPIGAVVLCWQSPGAPLTPAFGVKKAIRSMSSSLLVWLTLLVVSAAAIMPSGAMSADRQRRIGLVFPASASASAFAEEALWERMRELGWIDGKNVVTVKRFGNARLELLPALTREVLSTRVDVLITAGTQGALAAKRATSTIPIVGLMGDPVGAGLVESLARPGGNLTGVSVQNTEGIPGKWMELIREAVPGVSTVAVIVNPENPLSERMLGQIESAAAALGMKHVVFDARRPEDYANALKGARQRAEAVIVTPDSVAVHSRQLIAREAQKYGLPVLAGNSVFVEAGSLMAYGNDERATWRRMADYVDKILRGGKPENLPIEQPTEFRLAVNLRTAEALRLTLPETILLRADEVIR